MSENNTEKFSEKYFERNRKILSFLRKYPEMQKGEDLTMRFSKDELFNPHILMPRSELNPEIYENVNRFVEKYQGDNLHLTIFTDFENGTIENIFKEIYKEHFEVELKRINKYIWKRYIRATLLLLTSFIAFLTGQYLSKNNLGNSFIWSVVSNIGVFCIWEIGYTHFTRTDAREEKRRILRTMNAKITFVGKD